MSDTATISDNVVEITDADYRKKQLEMVWEENT